MFMPAEAFTDSSFALDSIQLLKLLLADPFIRFALVLAILVPAATLIIVRKAVGEPDAMLRKEKHHG